ncbi:MAG: leucine-rich repeat domain-containing protein, partial [Ruminococcus sp.]|nr:leucine-rich repeat domain-containing protein [Ruminococcus sp.]
MAFSSGFFNSKGLDRTYTAENFCDYLGSIICNGIQDNYGDCFAITANGDLTVTIGSGKAWINGHYFINDSVYTLDLSRYVDESLSKYLIIGIYCDTSDSVRKC